MSLQSSSLAYNVTGVKARRHQSLLNIWSLFTTASSLQQEEHRLIINDSLSWLIFQAIYFHNRQIWRNFTVLWIYDYIYLNKSKLFDSLQFYISIHFDISKYHYIRIKWHQNTRRHSKLLFFIFIQYFIVFVRITLDVHCLKNYMFLMKH